MDKNSKEGEKPPPPKSRRRRHIPILVFFSVLLLALILHRCYREPDPFSEIGGRGPAIAPIEPAVDSVASPDTLLPDTTGAKRPRMPRRAAEPPKTARVDSVPKAAAVDSVRPYVYADPWGGRHFDSVTVTLHCREDCLILYSLEDSVNFKSYEKPFTFRRDARLWITGVDSLARRSEPIRIDYVIARNPGACAQGSMPVDMPAGRIVCVDAHEWPNREGEFPRAFQTWKQAGDTCASVGKRLCALEEWRQACRGPDSETYPYAGKYHENHCPAKEAAPARSGRFPACRSYYGAYDMIGNLWEWTSTPADREDFYLVAGGNWSSGNEAVCGLAKFSFYPGVGYPFVGFRCCRDAVGK